MSNEAKDFRYIAPKYKKIGDFIAERAFSLYEASAWLLLAASLIYIIGGRSMFVQSVVGLFLAMAAMMYVFMKTERTDQLIMGEISNANIELKKPQKGQKPVKYYAKFGTIVQDFKGVSPEQARELNLKDQNVKYELLVHKSLYTMGALFAGATGAGKTVALDSCVMTPAIMSGSGFIFIEGKGDRPISEGVYARCVQYGREKDTFFVDFGAVSTGGFSHSVSPLAVGSATVLQETLSNLITIMSGDNSWVSDKALEVMQSVLFPLVVLRDLELFVDAQYIDKVEKLSDLERLPKVEFNLTQLGEYITVRRLVDLTYAFRNLLKDREFVKRLKEHRAHKSVKDYTKTYLNPLVSFLNNHSINVDDELIKPKVDKLDPDISKQINYGIQPWTTAFLTFGNEAIYGRVFNEEFPDFSFLEAMRDGKIVIVSLPSLQNSKDKNQKIGKIITALIKNALGEMISIGDIEGSERQKEIDKRLRPTKLPYTLIFDEISNYGSPMLGQISSMCRSIGTDKGGIGVIISGQSFTDLSRIDDGKNLESEQLLANLGISFFLNLSDKGYTELANKLAGKEEYYVEAMKEVVKSGGKGSADERQLSLVEKDMFTVDFFTKRLRKQTGEGVIVINGFGVGKIISNFYDPVEVDQFKTMRNISEQKLMGYFIDEGEDPDIEPERVEDAAA